MELTLKCTLDAVSVESRAALIDGFLVLESAARPLTADEKAAVDAAKKVLAQVDVSVVEQLSA